MGLRNGREKEEKVVYNPFRGVLSKEVISDQQQHRYERVIVKGRSKHVEIYLDIGDGKSKTRTLLARVNIGQLGISESFRRYLGKTQEIWVKGRVSTTPKAATFPQEGHSSYGLERPILRQYPASVQND